MLVPKSRGYCRLIQNEEDNAVVELALFFVAPDGSVTNHVN